MELTLVVQIIGGLALAGGGSIFVLAPHWFGIYYEIDIYAYMSSSSNSAEWTENFNDVTESSNPHQDQLTKDNNSPKIYYCSSLQKPSKKHSCSVFTSMEYGDTKNYINAGVFNKESQKIPSVSREENTYYKITVSKELWWSIQREKTETISVSETNDVDSPTSSLNILFAYDDAQIFTVNNNAESKNEEFEYAYVGKAIEITEPKPEQSQEIKRFDKQEYICSHWNAQFKKCNIHDLEDNVSGTRDITDVSFSYMTENSSTIKQNDWYLIKESWPNYQSLYVKVNSSDSPKTMKISQFKKSVIVSMNKAKKLFYF